MTGAVLTGTLAAALFAALIAGWVLHWVWCLLSRATSGDRARIADLATRLEAAERGRHAAETARAEAVAGYEARIAELEAEMEAAAAAGAAARELDAAEAARRLEELRREAEAAWDGLRHARRRIAELERALEER